MKTVKNVIYFTVNILFLISFLTIVIPLLYWFFTNENYIDLTDGFNKILK